MFDSPKYLKIRNGVFIDISSNAKFYKFMMLIDTWEGRVYNDFVVEVSGENKRKVARIYHGRRGYVQLKRELQILSKMCIPQVFGIDKSNVTTGLIFHGDEYMSSLQPLKRAAFFIRYVSHYIDTLEYLCLHIQSLRATINIHKPENIPIEKHGVMENQLKLPGQQGFVDFYVNSNGILNTMVSNSIISRPHIQQISACHYAFLSFRYMSHWWEPDVMAIITFVVISISFNKNSTAIHDTVTQTYFTGNHCVFKLKTDTVTLATLKLNADYQNISFWGNFHISDDNYHNWLYQAPQILENHAVIHNNIGNYLGIVSDVNIHIRITIFFSEINHYLESKTDAEVYLFISDPGIDPVDGKVSEPHIFWSLDKSGSEPLTEFSAALKGLSSSDVTMELMVGYWDRFYYEAFRDLYKMHGPMTSDFSQHVDRSELECGEQDRTRKSSSNIEDSVGIEYFKTLHEVAKHEEQQTFIWRTRPGNSSILESFLEDGFAVLGTVYDTRERRRRQKEIHEAGLFQRTDKDEWETISHADIDGATRF
ncbi:hypothetical protein BDQ17DRAFT_1478714 [Cyathus striatus]|nr:hypothetical protein BDQ17DRAFT_1478714 [Cyathus striatus]